MRIRSIKPEFWRSSDISLLAIEDRLLFIGLWSYVDDNGVGEDRLPIICADLFADDLSRDPRETLARVSGGLTRLSEAGRIVRYTTSGRDYLAINGWSKHQRIDKPNKPRFPLPNPENSTIRETLAEPSRDSREGLAPGTGEQGNRGTGEQGNRDVLRTSSSEPDGTDPDDDPRPEVRELCDRLADRIEANGSKRPTVGKRWHRAARLMLDRDGRTVEQVRYLIDWSQRDEFWRTNILSMSKLREKFDQLRLRVLEERRPVKGTTDDRVRAGLELAEKYRKEDEGDVEQAGSGHGALEGGRV